MSSVDFIQKEPRMRNLGDLYIIEIHGGQTPDCDERTMGLAFGCHSKRRKMQCRLCVSAAVAMSSKPSGCTRSPGSILHSCTPVNQIKQLVSRRSLRYPVPRRHIIGGLGGTGWIWCSYRVKFDFGSAKNRSCSPRARAQKFAKILVQALPLSYPVISKNAIASEENARSHIAWVLRFRRMNCGQCVNARNCNTL